MALAYRLIYTFDYGTAITKEHTYAEIYLLSEEIQTPKSLNGLNQGITFTLDSDGDPMFGPIKSHICTVNLYSEKNFEFIKFSNAKKNDLKIRVFKNGTDESNLYYEGYNTIVDYSESYVQPPYSVQFSFNDGISYLKMTKFELFPTGSAISAPDKYYNKAQYYPIREIFKYCFEESMDNQLEFWTACYIAPFENEPVTTELWNSWLSLKLNTSHWDDHTCYDVVSDILVSLGLQLRHGGNKWLIFSPLSIEKWAAPGYGINVLRTDFVPDRTEIIDNKPKKIGRVNDVTTDFSWINSSRTLNIDFKYDDVEITNKLVGPLDIFKRGHIVELGPDEFLKNWLYVREPNITTFTTETYIQYSTKVANINYRIYKEIEEAPDGHEEFDSVGRLRGMNAIKANVLYLPAASVKPKTAIKFSIKFQAGAPIWSPARLLNGKVDLDTEPERLFNYLFIVMDNNGKQYRLVPREPDLIDLKFKLDDKWHSDYTNKDYWIINQFSNYANYANPGEYTSLPTFLKILETNTFELEIEFQHIDPIKNASLEGPLTMWMYILDPYRLNFRLLDMTMSPVEELKIQDTTYSTTSEKEERTLKVEVPISTLFSNSSPVEYDQDNTTIFYQYFLDTFLNHINTWITDTAINIKLLTLLGEQYRSYNAKTKQIISSDIAGSMQTYYIFDETIGQQNTFIINRYEYDDYNGTSNIELISLTDFVPSAGEIPTKVFGVILFKLGATSVQISWQPTTGPSVLYYSIYRQVGGTGPFIKIYDTPGTSNLNYIDDLLSPDTVYQYTVSAVNSAGEGEQSVPQSIRTDANDLGVATNLRTQLLNNSTIKLNWEPPVFNNQVDRDGYRLSRKDETPRTNGIITPSRVIVDNIDPNAVEYIDSNLIQNTRFTYTIRAFNAVGDGIESNEAIEDTLCDVGDIPGLVNPPVINTVLWKTDIGGMQINLSLGDDGCAILKNSRIYWSTIEAGPYVLLDEFPAEVNQYVDYSILDGETKWYQIRQQNVVGEGIASNVMSGTGSTSTILPAPIRVKAYVKSVNSARLEWEDSPRVPVPRPSISYSIFQQINAVDAAIENIANNITDLEYLVDRTLNDDSEYTFYIQSIYPTGVSQLSNGAIVKTGLIPNAPINFLASLGGSGTTTYGLFAWSNVVPVNGTIDYRLFQRLPNVFDWTEIAVILYPDKVYRWYSLPADGLVYEYAVRARNELDMSDYSNIEDLSFELSKLPAPLDFVTTQPGQAADVLLEWDIPTELAPTGNNTFLSIVFTRTNPNNTTTFWTINTTWDQALRSYTDLDVALNPGIYKYDIQYAREQNGGDRGLIATSTIDVLPELLIIPDIELQSVIIGASFFGRNDYTTTAEVTNSFGNTGTIYLRAIDATGNTAKYHDWVTNLLIDMEWSTTFTGDAILPMAGQLRLDRLITSDTAYKIEIIPNPNYNIIGASFIETSVNKKAKPLNLRLDNTSGSNVLSWDAISDPGMDQTVGYSVVRTEINGTPEEIGWVSNGTSFDDKTAVAGVVYDYYVTGSNAADKLGLYFYNSDKAILNDIVLPSPPDVKFIVPPATPEVITLSQFSVYPEIEFSNGAGTVTVTGKYTDGTTNGTFSINSPTLDGSTVTAKVTSPVILQRGSADKTFTFSIDTSTDYNIISGPAYTEFIEKANVISNLSASLPTTGGIKLDWTVDTTHIDYVENRVYSYFIQYDSGNGFVTLTTVIGKDTSTVTHTTAFEGNTYTYRIYAASDAGGYVRSPLYATVTITNTPVNPTIDLQAPTLVKKLYDSYEYSWYIDRPAVNPSKNINVSFTLDDSINSFPPETTNYQYTFDTGTTPIKIRQRILGRDYTAFNNVGTGTLNSGIGYIVGIKTKNTPNIPPKRRVSNVKSTLVLTPIPNSDPSLTILSDPSFIVSWSQYNDVDGVTFGAYLIRRRADSYAWTDVVTITDNTVTSWTDNVSLYPGSTYTYSVHCYSKYNNVYNTTDITVPVETESIIVP